jgi:hypothetical protein
VLSLRSVKWSLHAPRSRSRHGAPFRIPHLASRSTPLSTCTSTTTNATSGPQQHSHTNPTPHISPSVVPLPSPRTIQIQHTTAVRRGAASCRAVLRSWPVTAAAGVVTAEPSSVAECRGRCYPSEVAPLAGGRRRGGRSGCPDTGHAVRRSVRILCPPCGQTSVQRVGRTSDVHASSVHATGVMRMSGQTGVRCP